MEHIQAAENDDDRIDRAGKIAMQYPDARSFAEDLQTAGVSNRQFQSIMGATPQEFHDYYRETEATKAEQYRAEWTEQRAREEGFVPEEETMPRGSLEKNLPELDQNILKTTEEAMRSELDNEVKYPSKFPRIVPNIITQEVIDKHFEGSAGEWMKWAQERPKIARNESTQ